ncbi:MAG: hypothetical protein JWN86_1594 [Planctomycetota bacterium]|nr:hypothetical protein [Planctomycetota bacterium]
MMIQAIIVAVIVGQSTRPEGQVKAKELGRSARLLALHEGDAAEFAIYRDADRKEKLELRREPVYRWTNPTRSGGQEGDVFLWTYGGRPEAVGCIFSHPEAVGQRVICHELHSLSQTVLLADRKATNRWEPQVAGITLQAVPDAPTPGATGPTRLRQMTAIARNFSGNSLDHGGKRWEFRLLPKPLYRYESTDIEVIDGALFAFVTSAGTDPELLLMLEARIQNDGSTRWEFTNARFSDLDLWLKYKDKEVWAGKPARIQEGGEPSQRYRLYVDRKIAEILPQSSGKP